MKYLKYIILLITTTTLISCEDYLTLYPPQGQVKAEYWKAKADVEATLIGAYSEFAQLDEKLFYFGELRADMLQYETSLDFDYRQIMDGNILPSNDLAEWDNFYKVINYCNLVLKYSDDVKAIDELFTDFEYLTFNAEALFLRSLAYFYLVRTFKDVPFVLEPYDTDEQNLFPDKTDGDVILDSVSLQLERILQDIPQEYETIEKTKGRATAGAVNALLADIALWQFNYEKSIEHIERIETQGNYMLTTAGAWFSNFSQGNTIESIFEFQFNSNQGLGNSLFGVTDYTRRQLLANDFAFNLFFSSAANEVIRGPGTIREFNQAIWKYIGESPDGLSVRGGAIRSDANLIIYRYADILLMKAEALSQLGRYSEAQELINQVRERALVEPVAIPGNANAFEDAILEERARELAYEGKRWYDLLRMGRRNNFARKETFIQIITQNLSSTQRRTLAAKLNDPFGWYLPIHNDEISNNLNLEQNPYYQQYETE